MSNKLRGLAPPSIPSGRVSLLIQKYRHYLTVNRYCLEALHSSCPSLRCPGTPSKGARFAKTLGTLSTQVPFQPVSPDLLQKPNAHHEPPAGEYRMWRASFPIDSAAEPGTLHTNERSSDPSHTQGPDAPHDRYPGVNEGGETSLVLPYRVAPEASDKSGGRGEASF